MPELPEVEVTRRGLLPILNQTIRQVTIRNHAMRWPIPAHLPELLVGNKLGQLNRRAKYILAEIHSEKSLVSGSLLLHLGMSGRLCLLERYIPPEKHDHLDIAFESGVVMRLRDPRRFGAVLWLEGNPEQHALLNHLGPEPLSNDFHASYLHKVLNARKAAIKTTLMDANVVVGVGNIYASESLFRAGILPQRAANSLSFVECGRLVEEIKNTLKEALEAGGSSLRDFFGADGNPGYFQQRYFVYGRTGQPCLKCKLPIQSIRQGQRSTFYCQLCQI